MKKMIVMTAAIISAVVANAAACTWGLTGAVTASVKNGSAVWSAEGTAVSPAAYLFLASDTAAVEAALAKGAMDTSLAKATTTTFNNKGRFTGVAIDIPAETLSYNMVLVYTDATDANKIWYQIAGSPTNASGSDDSMTPAVAAQFGATQFSSTGWTAVNVPEPTSGLLLLLGMAGLALRRRRA